MQRQSDVADFHRGDLPFGNHLEMVGPLPEMAYAVEKARDILLTRNDRIIGVDFLNRTCAFDTHFESILLRDPPKIFFPTASAQDCRHRHPAGMAAPGG
jgi:hypothetical protein